MEAATMPPETIEEMADDPVDEVDPLEQLTITGDSQLTLKVGGPVPKTAKLTLKGGALPVEGQFDRGDVVSLIVEARVTEVSFVDEEDKHGQVTSTERRHKARMIAVRRV